MKHFTLIILLSVCFAAIAAPPQKDGKNVVLLDAALFAEHVYDLDNDSIQWNYKGTHPCIIDFYADWCAPCRLLSPILSELADEYEGKIIVYKINIDKSPILFGLLGEETPLPSVLFCPKNGQSISYNGLLSKEEYQSLIETILLGK